MKRLIAILILLVPGFCWASVLSSSVRTTRAKTKVDSVPLSSAVRHGASGGGTWAADAWADYWDLDGTNDYLNASGAAVLTFDANLDMCLLVGYANDDDTVTENNIVYHGDSGENYSYALTFPYDNVKTVVYSSGTSSAKSSIVYNYSLAGQKSVALSVVENVDETHANIAVYADYPESGGGGTDTDLNQAVSTTQQLSAGFYIGTYADLTKKYNGKIYFLAIYHGHAITEANMNAVLAGTTNPADLSPVFYIDFSKAVAATYTSEIGGIVLTVNGSPTKGP